MSMKQFNAAFIGWVFSNSRKYFLLLFLTLSFTHLLAQGPDITFTPLANTCQENTSQTLTVNITDADGVPTSGAGLPHLYWRVNFGSFNAVTGTSLGGGNYSFTFGAGVAGQVISYYIVAQDNGGQISVSPSVGAGGFTTNPPAAATPPTTLHQFIIQNTLVAGVYTVGINVIYNFRTITDAVNAYNNSCLNGDVTFLLMDNNYNAANGEVFPITINNAQAGPTRRLTIKPNASVATVNISGSSNDAIFRLNGADYVTIDGSKNPDPMGRDRSVIITNTSTSTSSAVVWVASAGPSNPATNNTIKNCRIVGSWNASTGTPGTFAGIVSSGSSNTGIAADAPNSNNTFFSNDVSKAYFGIGLFGNGSTDQQNTITRNIVGSTAAANMLGFRGIYASNQTGLNIDSNDVKGVNSSYGSLVDVEPTAGIMLAGVSVNANVFNNTVQNIKNTNTLGLPVMGIALMSETANTNARIYNNFVFNITGNGNASDPLHNGHGIGLISGGGVKLYHNSIHLAVNQITAGTTAALYIGPAISMAGTLDVRNNIFSNRETTGTRYGLYCATTNIIFTHINYNNYYAGTGVGYLGGPRVTIGAWQLATGSDINSVAVNPLFVSATNLHLQVISPMNSVGTNVGITTDIDLETRSNTTPDIGADEMTPPACSANLGGTVTANVAQICNSGAPILFATGFSTGAGIDYQWQSSTDNINFTNLAGEKNPTTATPPSITVTTYYRLRVTCNAGPEGYSSVRTIPVNNPQVVSATNTATRCGVGTVSLTATGSAGTTLRWYDVPVNGEILGTGGTFVTPTVYANDSFYVDTNIGGVNTTVGPASPTAHGGSLGEGQTMWPTNFDVLAPTKLLSVDIYPIQSGQAGNLVIYRSDSTVLASVPYVTTVSGGNTAQVIPVNLSLPVGTGYIMWGTGYDDIPVSGLRRNVNGSVYPYSSAEVSITGNEFGPGFYMYFYRWRFSSGCQNTPRRLVKVNLTTPPAVTTTASLPSVCANTPTVLTASSPDPNYIYTWQPGNLVGASVTVSPGGPTSYVVLANNGTCANTDTIDITMKAQPQAVSATPATNTRCETDAALPLNVTGGIVNGELLLNENFNGSTDPAGWLKNTGTGAFTLSPSPTTLQGYAIKSNDSSQLYISNGLPNLGTNGRFLRSSMINATGYSTLTLTFWHHFSSFFEDTVFVQVMNSVTPPTGAGDAGWTNVATYIYTEGLNNAFVQRTINLDAFAGSANLYIRWKYKANGDYFYALDNVRLTGNDAPPLYSWAPTAGLFLDAAATIPYTGGNVAGVYAQPLVTTNYIASSTAPNGCQSKDTATINVRVAGGVISGDNTICAGGSANLSVVLTGTGPWTFTYTDGTTPVTISGVNASPYVFAVNPVANTTYTLVSVTDAFCAANPVNISGSAVISLTSVGVSSWLGANTNWHDQDNWCGLVPDASIDVIIPTGLPFYPVISAPAAAKNIQLAAGASLTIDAAANLDIAGSVTNDGILTNNGSIKLAGSVAQTFPGGSGSVPSMVSLVVDNSGPGVTINRKLRILESVTFTSGDITLQDTMTIASSISGTASVGKIGDDVEITYGAAGKFVVERYIPNHAKAWQLLSAPTIGQTVKQAWQENAAVPLQDLKPGYGTIMTSALPSALVNGFDFYTPLGPTISTYNAVTGRWDGIPSTNATPVSGKQGFMVLVRGDRSVTTYNAPATETTLRNTGRIYTPADPAPSSTVLPGKFESIGNPYASTIDFQEVLASSTGIDAKFYVWDPSLSGSNGLGRYQTISASNGYRPIPGSALYPAAVPFSKIQSGQAFLVYSTPGGTVNFDEEDKITGSDMMFRPPSLGNRAFMFASLEVGGLVADGNGVAFDRAFSNAFDKNDALKVANFGQNFGIRNNGEILALDARTAIFDHDTVFYNITGLTAGTHDLVFAPENIDPFTHAWLVDRYHGVITPVSTSDSTRISFTVVNNAASKAADRFYLVFKRMGRLPDMITLVGAERAGEEVLVSWKVKNERDVERYEVQKLDGTRGWQRIGASTPYSVQEIAEYGYVDAQPVIGNNHYRIITYKKGGEWLVSETLTVTIGESADVQVYPNPASGAEFHLLFNKVPPAKYTLQLYTESGSLAHTEFLDVTGDRRSYPVRPGRMLPQGTYFLVIEGKKYRKRLKVIVR